MIKILFYIISMCYFYVICMGDLPASMSMQHMHAWCWGGQKGVLSPLESELWMVVRCHMGAWN